MGSSDDDNNLTSDLTKLYNMVFNKSTLLLIIWFLALHFVCYRLLKFFFSENLDTLDYQSKLSRMLDIAVFSFLLLFLMASYYSVPNADKGVMLENLADYFKSYIDDKDSVYKTVVFLLLFYCAIYLFRIPMNTETKPAFISCTEFGVWTLFLIIVFVKFFNDVFGFSMMDIIYSFLNWSTLPNTSGVNNAVKVQPSDNDENCDEDGAAPDQPANPYNSYLSNLLSYVTPASVAKDESTESKTHDATISSVFSNFMTTLVSNSGAASSVVNTTDVHQTTMSNNISSNTSTTNSLQNTTMSSNISSNMLTTNSLQNESGFRNIKETFDTMAPVQSTVIDTDKPEVFNVAGSFTYDDAQLICAAYGANLADYDQIEDTYKEGGEWCNYGWSKGQHAFYPTQKSTWKKLQKSSDAKIRQSCGRQGINGGYVADKTKQMGVNCYGKKPKPTYIDDDLLEQQNSVINAKNEQDIELESKIQYWKQQIDDGTISVNHYNQALWSSYDKSTTPASQTTFRSAESVPTTFQSIINTFAPIARGPATTTTTKVASTTTTTKGASTSTSTKGPSNR